MTRRFRHFIFLIFVAFFVITSAMVILFAQGYRVDFASLKIVKTGGIFIKTSADEAKIYINDKYVGSTGGILNYSNLISGLKPKNYSIFIYKENYYPWNKSVEIKNGMVVELSNIILFPLELKRVKVAELPNQTISKFSINDNVIKIENGNLKTIKNYSLPEGKLLSNEKMKTATSSAESISPDENKKLYLSSGQLWVKYFNDEKKDPIKTAGDKELITLFESPVKLFDWFSNSEHLLWFNGNELTISELDNRGGKRNSVKFYLNIDSPVYWDRNKSEFYFFEKAANKSILYKINFQT